MGETERSCYIQTQLKLKDHEQISNRLFIIINKDYFYTLFVGLFLLSHRKLYYYFCLFIHYTWYLMEPMDLFWVLFYHATLKKITVLSVSVCI